jgi:predicted SnoaL-like aldol condensation-catalyzing enzyme
MNQAVTILQSLRKLVQLEAELRKVTADTTEHQEIQAKIESLRAPLPTSILSHYDGRKARGKLSVASVHNGVCGGCHLRLPRGRLADLIGKAFDTLFNKRDYAAAEKFWSPQYIQHSAHIGPGREGLFDLIKSTPATLKWEHGVILAEDDYVIVHSRYSGNGLPSAWVVVDIVRMENSILAEHWDAIQDEATEADSKSGNPMFGDSFPAPTGK